MKRVLYATLGTVALAGLGFFGVAPPLVDSRMNQTAADPPYPVTAAAQALHDVLLVVDLHNDLLLWRRDPLERHERGHTDVPRLIDGGMALQVFSVVTKSPRGQSYQGTEADSDNITLLAAAQGWPVSTWTSLRARALYQARKLRHAADRSEGALTLIRSRRDLEQYVTRRRTEPNILAGMLAVEGLHALEGDLEAVDVLYDAGYRMMAPTHMFDNRLAGSAQGIEKGGLTEFGRAVVQRMEDLDIIIDLAHVSTEAIDEILNMTTRPVVVSHTGVQATCAGPRNLSDRLVRRIAEQGGVIGIGFWPGAVCGTEPAAIVRAMRHVADLVGVEHVALGSDFDGTVLIKFDATGLAQITDALMQSEFSDDEIRLIMGGNALRLFRQTLPAGDEVAARR